MKNKSSESTAKALKNILNKYKTPVTTIECDRGREFFGDVKKLLKKDKIVLKFKYGKNKSAVAEHYIYIIKRRLYMLLRGTLSKNWVARVQQICEEYNNTPQKRLGWLKPSDITTFVDSVRVTEAKKAHNIPILTEPSFKEQKTNQENYIKELKNKFQEGSYVLLDFKETPVFDKSFDSSV